MLDVSSHTADNVRGVVVVTYINLSLSACANSPVKCYESYEYNAIIFNYEISIFIKYLY